MIPARMQVSFVIPLHNCLAFTQDCLRSLQATLPAGLAHEIILVDDGSTDGTRAWLETVTAPCRVLLNERNLGFAAACNRGAAGARGDFIFFLNNDLVFLPGWFEPMRGAFDRFAGAGLVGNVQLVATTGAIDHTGMLFNHQGKPVHDTVRPLRARLTGYRAVPALTGACLAVRSAEWRTLGGFDEGYVNGGEDVDLCLRALAAGRRNYVALRSVVRHHISQSPGRKRRDEENSRRLTEHWRQALVPLAARDWCRHYLDTEWHGSHDPEDFGLAAHALFYRLGWLRRPAARVEHGVQRAIEVELTRWRELLDGARPAGAGANGRGDPI
jgi:GT2 family glycosyltransferase